MNLVRFDPFSVVRDLDRLFDETAQPSVTTWMPRVDVIDADTNLLVRTEVPGIDPDAIDITIEGGTLSISGTRSFENDEDKGTYHRREIFEGSFRRTVLLPEGVNPEAVSATSKDGILEITVPKRPEILPRKIKVEVQR